MVKDNASKNTSAESKFDHLKHGSPERKAKIGLNKEGKHVNSKRIMKKKKKSLRASIKKKQ